MAAPPSPTGAPRWLLPQTGSRSGGRARGPPPGACTRTAPPSAARSASEARPPSRAAPPSALPSWPATGRRSRGSSPSASPASWSCRRWGPRCRPLPAASLSRFLRRRVGGPPRALPAERGAAAGPRRRWSPSQRPRGAEPCPRTRALGRARLRSRRRPEGPLPTPRPSPSGRRRCPLSWRCAGAWRSSEHGLRPLSPRSLGRPWFLIPMPLLAVRSRRLQHWGFQGLLETHSLKRGKGLCPVPGQD
mmetsp:Transcript_37419/g.88948  ORF Transcript_37419/g.88948 Transcript_37419/m.88948 type:complete len:247 (+) Transcript_37419:2-742(+)